MSRINLSGFYFEKSRFADNRDNYQKIVEDPLSSKKEREKAEDNLRLLELFPPGTYFQRLLAHRLKVFDIANPTWQRKGKLTYPRGELEIIVDLDLGPELMREEGIDLYEWVPKRHNVIHYIEKEKKIIGTEYEAVLREESALAKISEFFDIEIDRDDQAYNLKMKKGAFARALSGLTPLEIYFESYVRFINAEHDLTLELEKIIARAGFLPKGAELVGEPHRRRWHIPEDSKEPKSFFQVRFFKH